jgi:hypothetical protein
MQPANTLTSEPSNSSPKPKLHNVALWHIPHSNSLMVIDYTNKRWSDWCYDFTVDLSLPEKAKGLSSTTSHYEQAIENGMCLLASADSLGELVDLYPEYFI